MPDAPTFPGIYVEELPVGAHAVAGVETSVAAFIGMARQGPSDTPVDVRSWTEFERWFGALWRRSPMTYAVNQFFQNGGTHAVIVRVVNGGGVATVAVGTLRLAAASAGEWGEHLRVRVDHGAQPPTRGRKTFILTIRDTEANVTERFPDLSVSPAHPRFVGRILEQESTLVRVVAVGTTRPRALPATAGTDPMLAAPGSIAFNSDGDDGATIGDAGVSDSRLQASRCGLWALEQADLFNLLAVPPFEFGADITAQTRNAAAEYCRTRRAFFIADPLLAWTRPSDVTGSGGLASAAWGLAATPDAAVYFPRLRAADPLQNGGLTDFAPCGAVAGIYARTDAQHGVWKAPAGTGATMVGVSALAASVTDAECSQLSSAGVNCLRSFRGADHLVWGARTLCGNSASASEWKYIPVRRLALYIEESLYRGLQWVVFEPNDEALWTAIRQAVEAFLHERFREGAFQGSSPRDAYFVKCDRQTTSQADIDAGLTTVVVGFAPLRPAEFVLLNLALRVGTPP